MADWDYALAQHNKPRDGTAPNAWDRYKDRGNQWYSIIKNPPQGTLPVGAPVILQHNVPLVLPFYAASIRDDFELLGVQINPGDWPNSIPPTPADGVQVPGGVTVLQMLNAAASRFWHVYSIFSWKMSGMQNKQNFDVNYTQIQQPSGARKFLGGRSGRVDGSGYGATSFVKWPMASGDQLEISVTQTNPCQQDVTLDFYYLEVHREGAEWGAVCRRESYPCP